MKYNYLKIKLIGTIVFCIFLNGILNGQNKMVGFSINPKAGGYNLIGNDFGSIVGGELNFYKNHFVYTLEGYQYDDFELFAEPAEQYYQAGFLFGKYVGDRYLRLQFQAGVAAFWGFRRGDQLAGGYFWEYDKKNFFKPAVPLKIGLKFLPFRFLSIGMDLQANMNLEKMLYMPVLSIEIGKLRNRIVRKDDVVNNIVRELINQ